MKAEKTPGSEMMLVDVVSDIFAASGYTVEREVSFKKSGRMIIPDLIVKNEDTNYCVEIKYSLRYSAIDQMVNQVVYIAQAVNMCPILVVADYVSAQMHQRLKQLHSDLIVVDIANLLYAVKGVERLRNKLVACLNVVIDDVTPTTGFFQTNAIEHSNYSDSLIKELELCKPGKIASQEYEIICQKILMNVFLDDLALWKKQKSSNKGLYRFDLLGRIKDNNHKTVWSIIESFFNSKYIIFEFKNYSEEVTQKEIYTTEKYLYAKALRGVGIIIARNGYNENAYHAARGILRESGKLIIMLDQKDLIEMSKMKDNQEDPSQLLLDRLDDMLINLDK